MLDEVLYRLKGGGREGGTTQPPKKKEYEYVFAAKTLHDLRSAPALVQRDERMHLTAPSVEPRVLDTNVALKVLDGGSLGVEDDDNHGRPHYPVVEGLENGARSSLASASACRAPRTLTTATLLLFLLFLIRENAAVLNKARGV